MIKDNVIALKKPESIIDDYRRYFCHRTRQLISSFPDDRLNHHFRTGNIFQLALVFTIPLALSSSRCLFMEGPIPLICPNCSAVFVISDYVPDGATQPALTDAKYWEKVS